MGLSATSGVPCFPLRHAKGEWYGRPAHVFAFLISSMGLVVYFALLRFNSHDLTEIMALIFLCCSHSSRFNSLWPSDAIWRHRSWSTLVQVMACRLTAPNHYLNQCCLIVSTDHWRLSEGNITRDAPAINHKIQLQFARIKFLSNLPGAWVNFNDCLAESLLKVEKHATWGCIERHCWSYHPGTLSYKRSCLSFEDKPYLVPELQIPLNL